MGNAREGRAPYRYALVALVLAGCGRSTPPTYPEWSVHQNPVPPQASSSNGFDQYALAARDAEVKTGTYLNRVYFTPERKARALRLLATSLRLVERGVKRPCEFRFTPSAPFEAPPYQKGWRLLGRALVWRIEDALARNDYNKAIYNAVIATKFGFDLTGGSATDASLGLTIVDEARKAIVPYIGRFQNVHLKKLGNGLAYALKMKPSIESTITNEERNMMAAVQYVQDSYRNNRLEILKDKLGSWGRPAVKYLDDLHQKDHRERPGYFEGFANDAKSEVKWCLDQARLPACDREAEPKTAGEKPWRRLSRSFFYTLRPLIAMNDVTSARTRLLILESYLQCGVHLGRPAPKNLDRFSKPLRTDPFSGKTFIYRADGTDFIVYSVGPNFRDDGGETDESYTLPDLRVETDSR